MLKKITKAAKKASNGEQKLKNAPKSLIFLSDDQELSYLRQTPCIVKI